MRVAAAGKPAGGNVAVVGAQLTGTGQRNGLRIAPLGRHTMPVLPAPNGHRVVHLDPLGVLQHAEVAAPGQSHRVQRCGAQASLKAGLQAAAVGHIAIEQHLCAGRVGDQRQSPVSLQIGEVTDPVGVVLGQGIEVLPEEGLGARRVLSGPLSRFVLRPVSGRQGSVRFGKVGNLDERPMQQLFLFQLGQLRLPLQSRGRILQLPGRELVFLGLPVCDLLQQCRRPFPQFCRLYPQRRGFRPLASGPIHHGLCFLLSSGPFQPGLQLRGKLARVVEAICRVAGHGSFTGRHEGQGKALLAVLRDLGGAAEAEGQRVIDRKQGVEGQRWRGPDLMQHLLGTGPGVGRPPAQHHIQQSPQRVHIAAGIDAVHRSPCLLGRHVEGSARHLARLRLVCPLTAAVGLHRERLFSIEDRNRPSQQLGQPPVQHQHLTMASHHDVVRLQVPVDHTPAVRVAHGLAHQPERVDQSAERPSRSGRLPAAPTDRVHLGNDLAKGLPRDLFHGEPQPTVGKGAQIVDRHDPRVLQLGGGLGLFEEPGLQSGTTLHTGPKDLERQSSTQPPIPHPTHLAHAPHAQKAQIVVARQTIHRLGAGGRDRGLGQRAAAMGRVIPGVGEPGTGLIGRPGRAGIQRQR